MHTMRSRPSVDLNRTSERVINGGVDEGLEADQGNIFRILCNESMTNQARVMRRISAGIEGGNKSNAIKQYKLR